VYYALTLWGEEIAPLLLNNIHVYEHKKARVGLLVVLAV
jgi:hypothetical protein